MLSASPLTKSSEILSFMPRGQVFTLLLGLSKDKSEAGFKAKSCSVTLKEYIISMLFLICQSTFIYVILNSKNVLYIKELEQRNDPSASVH